MSGKPAVAIVGPGSLGTALALSLSQAGYRVSDIVVKDHARSRTAGRLLARKLGARVSTPTQDGLEAEVIWICVPDSHIRSVAQTLSRTGEWKGRVVFHSSGAFSSNELRALKRRGAAVASLHPMMTFVPGVMPELSGVPFAVEGDRRAVIAARRITRDLGASSFLITKRHKAAYHAWGAFASPLLVAALVTGEQVARSAGISRKDARRRMGPIVNQTIRNYLANGGAASFSGPIIRGDAATIRKHLQVLAKIPGAREVYVALARSAIRNLPSGNRKVLGRILK